MKLTRNLSQTKKKPSAEKNDKINGFWKKAAGITIVPS